MVHIIEFDGQKPKIDPTAFLAPDVWIIGKVELREKVNIWTGSVIRGDDDRIVIGRKTTILEHCLIEAPAGMPVGIGEATIISHGAIVHGACIGNHVLIGIGAIVLDGAKVGNGAIIGSGTLISPRTAIPPRKLVLGIPGRTVRDVNAVDTENLNQEHKLILAKAEKYKTLYRNFKS